MPDERIAYKNLILDTATVASPTLEIGTYVGNQWRINSNLAQTLSIISSETDLASMKVWGFKGETTKNLTGDGTTLTFTFTDYASIISISEVKVGGVDQTPGTDYTYDDETGELTFDSAPADGAAISVTVMKSALTESDVSSEAFSSTKSLNFPEETGSYTIGVRLWDNVGNQSNAQTITVYLDLTKPTVHISSITAPTPNGLTPPKISKITNYDTATIEWSADEDFVEYKVCVVATTTAAHNAGIVIGSTNGSTNVSDSTGSTTYLADANQTTTIKGADLEAASAGDGNKIIKIFVKDQSGYWSE